jgi:hypothetical protein
VKNQKVEEIPDYDPSKKSLCYDIPQIWFKSNPYSVFEINCSKTLKKIKDIIADPITTLPLVKVLDVRQGVISGGNRKWKDRLQKLNLPEYGENFEVHKKDLPKVPSTDSQYLRKLVNGDSVGEFVVNWELHPSYLVYDEDYLTAPREPSVFEQPEKIILMAKPRFLQASLDCDNIYVTNDTYIARWRENPEYKPSMKYILGLLNSKILDLFYKMRHCEYVRGGWFVRYGIFFDELPIKKADPSQEKEIVSLVDRLIDARTKIVGGERSLTSLSSMLDESAAPSTIGGLSTIVDLKDRTGGEMAVNTIYLRGNTVYFNKEKTASIRCISEDAAKFVSELMDEEIETLRNRTLDEVMSLIKLPKDIDSLQQVGRYIKQKKHIIKRSSEQVTKLKDQLDEKVAEIYGLGDKINLIRNAIKVISGDIDLGKH